MSSSIPPSVNSPTTLTTATSSPSDLADTSTTPTPTSYILPLLLVFLIAGPFLCYLYLRYWSSTHSAHLALHGHAALVQDVEHFSSSAAVAGNSSARLARISSTRSNSILETGLDERGEAPPPYRSAEAAADGMGTRNADVDVDKEVEVVTVREVAGPVERERACVTQEAGVEMGMLRSGGLLPAYRASAGPVTATAEEAGGEERHVGPTRPVAVITVSDRLEDVDLEEQVQQQQLWQRRDGRASRIQGRRRERWGFWRRLMSSDGGNSV